jgi:protein translocase SecG subunit
LKPLVIAASKLPVPIATAPHAPGAVPASAAPATASTILQNNPALIVQQTWAQQHLGWLTHTVAAIGIISAILMIVLLAVQTTKQEGLTGTIGGRVESTYRGRLGADEQLKRLTGVVVGVWLFSYVLLSLTGI